MASVVSDKGFTKHAARRIQQRSIPPVLVDYLIEFGECRPAGNGAESYYFSKKGWRQLNRYLGPLSKHFDKYRHVYAVLADGQVITAAYIH